MMLVAYDWCARAAAPVNRQACMPVDLLAPGLVQHERRGERSLEVS